MSKKIKVYRNKRAAITDLISQDDAVLDVGFWGQAVKRDSLEWPHRLLQERAREVYGVDIHYDEDALEHPERYTKGNAEDFDFERHFDVIFAGDLIEHLSNPGLFLDACAKNSNKDGRLILTTPNAFNLFTLLEKFFKKEPSVNSDHTFYFNVTVLTKLLEKNGWKVVSEDYIDSFKGDISMKRRTVYYLGKILKMFTPKYLGTLVIVAKKM